MLNNLVREVAFGLMLIIMMIFFLTLPASAENIEIRVDKMNDYQFEEIQRGWPYDQSICMMSVLDDLRRAPLEEQRENVVRWNEKEGWIELHTINERSETKWRCAKDIVQYYEVFSGDGRWSTIKYEELFPR